MSDSFNLEIQHNSTTPPKYYFTILPNFLYVRGIPYPTIIERDIKYTRMNILLPYHHCQDATEFDPNQ